VPRRRAPLRVADLGDAWIERPFELQGALAEVAAFLVF
jgi:hypothetical protein